MHLESIHHEPLDGTGKILTTVVIRQVPSQCILARLIIDALGKPGIDNDLEILGSGDTWTIMWSQPQVMMGSTEALITQAIS